MEFKKFITISFTYNEKRYSHKVEKKFIDTTTYEDTWVYYFDEDGLRFEVWGSLDENNEPTTTDAFAVNVYEIADGEGTQLEQIDDVDVDDCV